jgi:hypothetical protein
VFFVGINASSNRIRTAPRMSFGIKLYLKAIN